MPGPKKVLIIGLGSLARHPPPLPHRLPQQNGRPPPMGLGLPRRSTRRPRRHRQGRNVAPASNRRESQQASRPAPRRPTPPFQHPASTLQLRVPLFKQIPVRHSQRLYDSVTHSNKLLKIVPTAAHNNVLAVGGTSLYVDLSEFFLTHLK